MMDRRYVKVVDQTPRGGSGRYLVFGVSAGIAGFPVAFSVEREEPLRWIALHLLCWYVAIAWRRQDAAEGGAAIC
jgi:hypothetical protein